MFRTEASDPEPTSWPYRLSADLGIEELSAIRQRVEELASQAQYGWGHTIDFGPFVKEGLLEDNFLEIVGRFIHAGWWPRMQGLRIADIGCFTGGIALLAAHQGAEKVIAVDEIPEHLAQCSYLCDLFDVRNVCPLGAPLYQLPNHLARNSLDCVILSGVLYHLSDMLVGLLIVRDLLKVGGCLLIESNAIPDTECSYANFARFALGAWWQPSILCIKDICEFMGLSGFEFQFYRPDRCLAIARKTEDSQIPFRRGLNYPFSELRDFHYRPPNAESMAPK